MDGSESLSTRIKISAFFIVLVISLFFIPAKWVGLDNGIKISPANSSKNQPFGLVQAQNIAESVDDDIDGDGLLSWQEALHGTNANNADTDGDGTPDGEETKNNRDPRKAGPNDKLVDIYESKDPKIIASLNNLNDPNNLTSQTVKNIFSATALLKSNNVPSEQIIDSVQKSIIDENYNAIKPKIYTESSLKIKNTANLSELKTYGNAVAMIILYIADILPPEDDLALLTEYANKNNADLLKKFESKVKRLKETRDYLLESTTVPKKAVTVHLFYLNSLENYISVLDNLSKTKDDPIRGMLAFKNYQSSVNNFSTSIKNFSEFFNKETLVFSNKEFGYLFTYYIINNN